MADSKADFAAMFAAGGLNYVRGLILVKRRDFISLWFPISSKGDC